MKGDLHPAAFRLFSTQPVRTHEWQPREFAVRTTGVAIKVDGREFPSMSAASRELGLTRRVIDRMLDRGEAEYVE